MRNFLNLLIGTITGLILGAIIVYAITNGNITSLESANNELDDEKKNLIANYSNLLNEFDELKLQEALFTREKKILTDSSEGRLRVINITASQYEFEPNLIEADYGDIIILRIWSNLDRESGFPAHGFVLNDWFIDEKLPKDSWKTIIFVADKPGEHYYFCNLECGEGHPDMIGRIVIQEP